MKRIISFSGRTNGNCDQIASFIAGPQDQVVFFRDLHVHPCSGCEYECFHSECKYRADDLYALYDTMCHYNKVILIIPMYCGNPSSLYFVFQERCQDYFMHNDVYEAFIQRLYIIGVYGKQKNSPDFIPCLEKWFDSTPYRNRVLGIERHLHGQTMQDAILDVPEEKARIRGFVLG